MQYELLQTPLSDQQNKEIHSSATQVIKSEDLMYIVDSGASLQMMGGRSLTSGKEKNMSKTINYLHIQTSDGLVHFTNEAKVCIQELGNCVCVLHRQIRSSRRVHQAKSYSIMRYNSNRARLRKGKPSERKSSGGDHVFFLCGTFLRRDDKRRCTT